MSIQEQILPCFIRVLRQPAGLSVWSLWVSNWVLGGRVRAWGLGFVFGGLEFRVWGSGF